MLKCKLVLSPRIKPNPSRFNPTQSPAHPSAPSPPPYLVNLHRKFHRKFWRQTMCMHQLKCLKKIWSGLRSDLRSVCFFVFMCNISSINTPLVFVLKTSWVENKSLWVNCFLVYDCCLSVICVRAVSIIAERNTVSVLPFC